MLKTFLPVFLILIVLVSVSGCLGPTISTGNGVIIEAFEPDFDKIYADESLLLRLKIRNKGTVDADIKSVSLEGADWLKSASCEPAITGKLLPTVPDQGLDGETKNCNFEVNDDGGLKSKIPESLAVTYYPVVKIKYAYSTSTVQSITVLTRNELRSLQDRGGSLPAETVSSTSSPVSITVKAKSPIRVSDDGGSVTFPIEIDINNVGNGIAYSRDQNNKINLEIDAEGMSLDCSDGEITLWKGKSNTIGCKVTVSGIDAITKKLIKVKATYDYLVDAVTSVTVTGVENK